MVAKLLFSGRPLLTLAAAIAALAQPGPVLAQTDIFSQYQETGNPQAPTAIGKLFLNGFCSASVISGKNIIVTAAHCCWDRTKNNWIRSWSFAPAAAASPASCKVRWPVAPR